jgi:hypothetical protein
VRCAIAAFAVLSLGPALGAQGVRITGITTVQSVDARPLVPDSVPVAQATGDGPYRILADGTLVRCVGTEPFCRFLRSGSRVTAVPVVQDVELTAWGLGQGISAHARLRGRESLNGDEFLWPRAGDRFDALEAYLQLDRSRWRARFGRQWAQNGLGLYNFDGGEALARRGASQIELFAGRSLVQGLNEGFTAGALGSVDDLPPDDNAYLLGARVASRWQNRTSLAAVYQREIRADRAGLYSERVALDGSTRLGGALIDGQWTYDLMGGEVNEARLRGARDLPRRFSGTLELRRHRPFFEWWTIWGAFTPVGFDEARATLGWHSKDARLSVDASAARRRYDDAGTGLTSMPLRGDGWRAGGGIEWTATERWSTHAEYDIDVGAGASRSDATAGVRWQPSEEVFLGGSVSALQNIYEFRVGTGRVIGLSVSGGTRLARDARLVLDAALYANRNSNGSPAANWGQRRVAMRFEWTMGNDPGEAATRSGTGSGR